MNKSQSKEYLESMLKGIVPVNFPLALECFRRHYRSNTEKLELLLSESAELTIGRADFNSRCFLINGQSVSKELDKPTDAAKISVGCRTVARDDEPPHIVASRAPGIEIDHENEGGFAAIVDKFVQQHGEKTIMQYVGKVTGGARETLNEPLRSAFVQLHREMTSNWAQCVPVTVEEHRRRTRQRAISRIRSRPCALS